DYGLGQRQFGKGWLDKSFTLIGRIPLFSRPVLVSLRNTIRRKARLLLTLSTLTLGGAIFIGVLNLNTSFAIAIDDALGYFLSDVNVSLNRDYRIEQIQAIAMQVPGVSRLEAWSGATGQVLSDDKLSGVDVVMVAPPAGSTLIRPVITGGRWLLPEDDNAVVIGNHMITQRPDLKVGDDIIIKINMKEYTWHIVGIYRLTGNASMPLLYANREYLARLMGNVGRATDFRIVTSRGDAQTQSLVAKQLQAALEGAGISVGGITTGAEQVELQKSSTNILVYFLLFMAVLIALVGGIGLMGMMSMNVLERTRELGVMRSIGASNGEVLRMVIVEGLLIGIISWLFGMLLAVPLAQMMDYAVGIAFLTLPLPFVFSMQGVLVWLVIVLVLSGLASILPALHAVRLTVHDALAYE
ncbi:MAG TPA: FtsX-like permease family protein, partial [Anaerolineae bacterium]